MPVGVSIVEFNTKDFLKNCLKQLKKQQISQKLNIWVLDNNSSDGSVEMLKKEFSDVGLIESRENLGFAKGQNKILKKITDDYVLILNPDTEFGSIEVQEMVKFMDANPDCAISSCILLDQKGGLDSNGGDLPFGVALFTWLFNLDFKNFPNFHRVDNEYYQKAKDVDWVGGTFMFARKKILDRIGYFNENYFMYFEDVDLCFRAKKVGYRIMINPKVRIKHISGASSKNPRLSQWKGEFQGLIRFYNENFGLIAGFFVRIFVYAAIILRAIAFLLTGKKEKALIYGKVLLNV